MFFSTPGPKQEAKVGSFSLKAINKIAAVVFDKRDVRDGFLVANYSSSILCDSEGMQQISCKYPNNVTSNQQRGEQTRQNMIDNIKVNECPGQAVQSASGGYPDCNKLVIKSHRTTNECFHGGGFTLCLVNQVS